MFPPALYPSKWALVISKIVLYFCKSFLSLEMKFTFLCVKSGHKSSVRFNYFQLILILLILSTVAVVLPILKLSPSLRIPYCVSSNRILGLKNGLALSPYISSLVSEVEGTSNRLWGVCSLEVCSDNSILGNICSCWCGKLSLSNNFLKNSANYFINASRLTLVSRILSRNLTQLS